MKFTSDIDIDFANREHALSVLGEHTPASMVKRDGTVVKHNTGVYFHQVPTEALGRWCGLDYQQAEEVGYIKLDFLNVAVYGMVRDRSHMLELFDREPQWDRLYDPAIATDLIHVGNHLDTLNKMPERVDSYMKLAMFISVIRPAKRHLIGLPWNIVAQTIWDAPKDGSYWFKKPHSVSYARLVAVHLNLLCDAANQGN